MRKLQIDECTLVSGGTEATARRGDENETTVIVDTTQDNAFDIARAIARLRGKRDLNSTGGVSSGLFGGNLTQAAPNADYVFEGVDEEGAAVEFQVYLDSETNEVSLSGVQDWEVAIASEYFGFDETEHVVYDADGFISYPSYDYERETTIPDITIPETTETTDTTIEVVMPVDPITEPSLLTVDDVQDLSIAEIEAAIEGGLIPFVLDHDTNASVSIGGLDMTNQQFHDAIAGQLEIGPQINGLLELPYSGLDGIRDFFTLTLVEDKEHYTVYQLEPFGANSSSLGSVYDIILLNSGEVLIFPDENNSTAPHYVLLPDDFNASTLVDIIELNEFDTLNISVMQGLDPDLQLTLNDFTDYTGAQLYNAGYATNPGFVLSGVDNSDNEIRFGFSLAYPDDDEDQRPDLSFTTQSNGLENSTAEVALSLNETEFELATQLALVTAFTQEAYLLLGEPYTQLTGDNPPESFTQSGLVYTLGDTINDIQIMEVQPISGYSFYPFNDFNPFYAYQINDTWHVVNQGGLA